MVRFLVILMSLCALGAQVAQHPDAAAAPTTSAPAVGMDQLRKWVEELGDLEATRREAAYDRLLELNRSDLSELQRVAAGFRPLTPSRSIALQQVVEHLYLKGEKYEANDTAGFLGVRLGDVIEWEAAGQDTKPGPHTGVMIAGRMAGFGGFQALRDGDIIVAVADRPATLISSLESLRVVIQSFSAGQMIHLQVIRQGRYIRTSAVLDGTPVLVGQSTLEELLLQRREKAEEYWRTHFADLMGEGH